MVRKASASFLIIALVCAVLFPEECDAHLAVGRVHFRPGKRGNMALGRVDFRPGKRFNLALGRAVKKETKKSPNDAAAFYGTCQPESVEYQNIKFFQALEAYESFLINCGINLEELIGEESM